MHIADPLLSAVVLIPFTLFAGYYFLSILWQTFDDASELTTWQGHLYFAGLLIMQIVGIGIFVFALYVAVYAGLGAG